MDDIERRILRTLLYFLTIWCGVMFFPKGVEDARNPSVTKTIEKTAMGVSFIIGLSGLVISAKKLPPIKPPE